MVPAEYLFIVRHGETEANEKGVEAGPLDYPLTKKGKKEVRFTAKILSKTKINAVYSSPIFRACQTAKILASPHDLKIKTLEELTEAKIKPEYVGKKGRHHILSDPEVYSETNKDLLDRAKKAIEIIIKATQGNAIVVSHGDVINALLEGVVERKISKEKYYVLDTDPAALSVLKVKERLIMILYNYRRKMFEEL
jgi:uncharacterized phosphatase